MAHANPTIGDPPLTVNFDGGGSTGLVDTIQWDFGDGSTPATTAVVSHVYQNAGEYIAVLTLTQAGFGVRDFERILVGGNAARRRRRRSPNRFGGVLGPDSSGVNTDLLASGLNVLLQFNKVQSDTLRFNGFMDPSSLPASTDTQTATFTLAGRSYSGHLGFHRSVSNGHGKAER